MFLIGSLICNQFRIRNNWPGRNSVKQDPDSKKDPYSGREIILGCFKSNAFSTNPLLLTDTQKRLPIKPNKIKTA